MTTLSRRAWLKGLGAVAGAAVGSRLGAKHLLGDAFAAPTQTKSAVVSVFFEGGFNAVFSSTDSFAGSNAFGASGKTKAVGNGLVIDEPTFGQLGDWALGHMAAIGNRHGATDHISALRNNFSDGTRSYVLQLAAAMGGSAAFKAAALGNLPISGGPSTSEGGVSLQLLRTMGDVETALGIGAVNFNRPARTAASKALEQSRTMSQQMLGKNPRSGSFAKDGYDTVVDSLGKAPLSVDVANVAQAYGARGDRLDAIPAKLAAAELMIRSGTNVITLSDPGWDTHGDRSGNTARRRMTTEIIPPLKTFLSRIRSEPDLAAMNISVIIHGDFARSLPSSDHAPALSALVIGPNVKVGTTGKVSGGVTLPEGTGASREMWSYLAALTKISENPFGANPHGLVL